MPATVTANKNKVLHNISNKGSQGEPKDLKSNLSGGVDKTGSKAGLVSERESTPLVLPTTTTTSSDSTTTTTTTTTTVTTTSVAAVHKGTISSLSSSANIKAGQFMLIVRQNPDESVTLTTTTATTTKTTNNADDTSTTSTATSAKTETCTMKIDHTLNAPKDGKLTFKVKVGDSVVVGTVVAEISTTTETTETTSNAT